MSMHKLDITAIILAKNEEINIKRAIDSASFCAHILVADDSSEDRTKQIAEKSGCEIIDLPPHLSFHEKRKFAMDKATTRWVLFLDADEEVTQPLREEIKEAWNKRKTTTVAYYLKRRDFWWGREMKYGETLKARNSGICRLIDKKEGQWIRVVHEVWVPNGSVITLNNFINHHPHPTLKEFITDINDYSTRRAQELFHAEKQTNILEIIFFPLFKFVLTYFIYLGFLDGVPGFVYSFLMSFHSFLVRTKLYQYSRLSQTLA